MNTPVTKNGIAKYDHLPAEEAVRKAWNEAGRVPAWHNNAKDKVAELMPLLARALDRL